MALFKNNTNKGIGVSAGGGVLAEQLPHTIFVEPGKIVAGGLHLKKTKLTLLTGAEILGDLVASVVENVPYGKLSLISGTKTFHFSKYTHLLDTGSMLITNQDYFNKPIDCLVIDSDANHEFIYSALVIPNTLAIS